MIAQQKVAQLRSETEECIGQLAFRTDENLSVEVEEPREAPRDRIPAERLAPLAEPRGRGVERARRAEEIDPARDRLRGGALAILAEDREQLLFRATAFGDEVDRPLLKSDGSYTYFASDIAYHRSKFERGFASMIDVWGADHGGYVKRMQAAVKAVSAGKAELDLGPVIGDVGREIGVGPVRLEQRPVDVVPELGRPEQGLFAILPVLGQLALRRRQALAAGSTACPARPSPCGFFPSLRAWPRS